MSSRSNFDFANTIFSPEGSLYQVEYAYKAVKSTGITSIAIRGKDSVVVLSQRKVPDKLMVPESITSMHKVSPTLGICITGRPADGRVVVNEARDLASKFKYDNGFNMHIELLAKRLARRAQVDTQYNGRRSMGVSATVIGMDQDDATGVLKPALFKVDPSGHFVGYFACASGQKETEAISQLEKKMKQKPFEEMSAVEISEASLAVLQAVCGEALKARDVEMARVTPDAPIFGIVADQEVENMLTALAERD